MPFAAAESYFTYPSRVPGRSPCPIVPIEVADGSSFLSSLGRAQATIYRVYLTVSSFTAWHVAVT